MILGKRVLALIPARGGSKGLPRKNIKLLGGRPLVAWPVLAACGSAMVDRIVVSTDDREIAEAARQAGADVPFLRPAELSSDSATTVSVVRHALEELGKKGEVYEYVVLLEPTSPLTETSDIEKALTMLHGARDRADAVVGIARVQTTHPEYDVRLGSDGVIRPYAAVDFRSLRRRQEIEELYFLEGSLYCSAADVLIEKGSFYHERTLGYAVPRWKSFEVDDLVDLVCIEAILARREELRETQ